MGKPVETVPQIFLDQKHIGGCTDFEAYAKEHRACLRLSNARRPHPEGVLFTVLPLLQQAARK